MSLHAAGAADVAAPAIAEVLPQALEIAHVNPRDGIASWFSQNSANPSAQTTQGNWRVDWSVETDTEEPGAHLSLTDRTCTTNCQAE